MAAPENACMWDFTSRCTSSGCPKTFEKTPVPPVRAYSLSATPLKAESIHLEKHVQSINIYSSAMDLKVFPLHRLKIKDH